jgi:hypothetical protein
MMQELAAIRSLLYAQAKDGNRPAEGAIGRVADIALDLLGTRLSAKLEETVNS